MLTAQDDFTTCIVCAALDDLTAGTSKLPSVSKVKSRAWFLYVQWRDAFLEQRVEYVLDRVPTWKKKTTSWKKWRRGRWSRCSGLLVKGVGWPRHFT